MPRTSPEAVWRELAGRLSTWKRGGQRAVHKPLLLLLLLGRAERGEQAGIRFSDLTESLTHLLQAFGPPRRSYHPEYPFWHLRTDGIWTVRDAERMPLKQAGTSPTRRTLLDLDATGEVPARLWRAIESDRALRESVALGLLDEFWPASLHEDILRAVGLTLGVAEVPSAEKRPRDPAFRHIVLRAYEQRCAVCGYDGRLGSESFALEAAHVRWHCYGGPDEVTNGLALCSFHHKALDKGALGIDEDFHIQVSMDVVGGEAVEALLFRHVHAPLRRPQAGVALPDARHVRWHERQVFRAPPRGGGSGSDGA